MELFRITGGKRLSGTIDIKGSKNAALAVMSSVLLADGVTVLRNVPELSDTRIKAGLLAKFGAKVEWVEGSLFIDCSNLFAGTADEETVRLIRTSFYMLGPLLARIGEVSLPAPGGCRIGARPVNLHMRGLELLGAEIDLVGGCYVGKASKLRGAEIYLDFPSAGATQHLMSTACLAEGETVIENAAMEPEVTALAAFLQAIGAQISGAGTPTIRIMGSPKLYGAEYRVPSDRLQAGTFLLAGAITRGDVRVTNVDPEHQTALLNKLKEAGARVSEGKDWVRVAVNNPLEAIRVMTMPYPGFPTDMQQPMAALLTLANGTSVVEETIYESRTGHIPELVRMGANIKTEGRSAIITGVSSLQGAVVEATDLRAGAALCLAGLAAEGTTHVKNVHYIDRGYEDLESSMKMLGADFERAEEVEGRGVGVTP